MRREVNLADFPQETVSKILEKSPFGEDIAILDKAGNVVSVIIGVKTYKYLLAKIEEDEQIIDNEELKDFDTKKEINKAVDFDSFIKGNQEMSIIKRTKVIAINGYDSVVCKS